MRNYILILLQALLVISCNQKTKEELTVQDIEIFKKTIAWDLIQSVDENDVFKIQNRLKGNPKLVDFQDPIFGTTPLMWAVSAEKYQSAKALLDNGANPNIISKIGATALFRDSHITEVNSWDEFVDVLENKTGFISAHWDGTPETEEKIKEMTKATIRCIP